MTQLFWQVDILQIRELRIHLADKITLQNDLKTWLGHINPV